MDKQHSRPYCTLAVMATALALIVIMLGGYTRLKDAGLGCPDWPGCYGQLSVPRTPDAIQKAQTLFPGQPVVAAKAWPEMVHRYFAGSLGILCFVLGSLAIRRRRQRQQSVFPPVLLMGLILFQALLGMWTVTWQLHPLVVMGHLLGGMAIVALLWLLTLHAYHSTKANPQISRKLRPWAIAALVMVALQISLGGWTSANYASLACPHFPFCHGSFFPNMDFTNAFDLFKPIGHNYEGGVLDSTARVTIQMVHRYGAFITLALVGYLATFLSFRATNTSLRRLGYVTWLTLAAQFSLGVLNIETMLSLPIAVAHNGMAALLFLVMVTLFYKLSPPQPATS